QRACPSCTSLVVSGSWGSLPCHPAVLSARPWNRACGSQLFRELPRSLSPPRSGRLRAGCWPAEFLSVAAGRERGAPSGCAGDFAGGGAVAARFAELGSAGWSSGVQGCGEADSGFAVVGYSLGWQPGPPAGLRLRVEAEAEVAGAAGLT